MNEIGLFDINFDTGDCYWSFELKRMLGVRHDAPTEFHLLLQCIHPDDRRAFGRNAMQPFRFDCPRHSSIDFRVIHNDDRVHWLHMDGERSYVRVIRKTSYGSSASRWKSARQQVCRGRRD